LYSSMGGARFGGEVGAAYLLLRKPADSRQ
jgi:hypothetical protein